MKWNMVLGALVISVGMCGQGFGFELLERMLGVNDNCGCAPSCGCEVEPSCGCEAATACGCQTDPGCGSEADPGYGCEQQSCCPQPGCKKKRCGLLDGLFKHRGCGCKKKSCCEPSCGCEAEPSCGCGADPGCGCEAEPSCGCEQQSCCPQPCCKKKHCGGLGLLKGLFRHHRKKSCCAPSCGCEAEPSCGCEPSCGFATGGVATPTDAGGSDDAAPMPPAPMADPSASLQSRRRIVQVSSVIRRR
jgi:hypothetical protein